MLSLHTKKINNTNKLIQISYHSALTKFKNCKTLKKNLKKKKICTPNTGRYCPKLAGTKR